MALCFVSDLLGQFSDNSIPAPEDAGSQKGPEQDTAGLIHVVSERPDLLSDGDTCSMVRHVFHPVRRNRKFSPGRFTETGPGLHSRFLI